MRSRIAPVVNFLLSVSVVAFAASPSFGLQLLAGWPAIVVLVALFLFAQLFSAFLKGTTIKCYIDTFSSLAGIISSLADGTNAGPRILLQPSHAIEALLRRAREFANDTLRIPADARLTATLMLPVYNEDGSVRGLQAAYRAELQWNPQRKVVPLDAPGAGKAFTTGRPQGVPDIAELVRRDPRDPWPYRSIAAFPVLAGDYEDCPRSIGVITLDCIVPLIFTDSCVRRQLAPFIQPIAQLVGLAMRLHAETQSSALHAPVATAVAEQLRDLVVAPPPSEVTQ
jgi:hypothetical protein